MVHHPRDLPRQPRKAPFILNLPDTNESSVTARLENARRKQWHQQGEALLTIENARSFLNATGLVLFAPRPQIAAPSPSFVEAVLGEPNATPTLAQVAPAREMLARLVAEGLAVPLNLLGIGSVIGQAGDLPDFIVSAQVFSYVFTLRGDKAWKQPPQGTGVAKFSNLAVAAHEALTRRGPLSAYDLATELGKEVTEGAVLRTLGELWSHLRVLPLPQVDGQATLWELAGTRLNKQIKAGANAGLPTALSALISLYLGQAIVASEDEVESFLSPLAARSRVRDVLHALLAARELDTVAIEGKTVLHVAGAVPAFLSEETMVVPAAEGVATVADQPAAEEDAVAGMAAASVEQLGEVESAEPGPRIAKFVPSRRPAAKDLAKAKPAKFASKTSGGPSKPFGEKRPFTPRDVKSRPPFRDGKSARPSGERRSFKPADGAAGEGRPRFVRPERLDGKPDRERRPFVKREGSDSRPPRKPFDRGGERPAARKPFDRSSDSRPPRKPFERSAGDRAPRKFGDRSSDSRPPRKPFDRGGERPTVRKPFSRSAEDRPARKPFDRGGDRPAARKPFDRSSDSRPTRKPFDRGGDRPPAHKTFGSPGRFAPRGEASSRGDRDGREFKPKPFGRRDESNTGERSRAGGFGGKRPFVKSGEASRPFRGKERGEGVRPERMGFGARKVGSARPGGAKPSGPGGRFGEKKFGARPGGAKFGVKPGGAKFGARPGGGKFGAKKPSGRPAGARGSKPSRSQGDKEA